MPFSCISSFSKYTANMASNRYPITQADGGVENVYLIFDAFCSILNALKTLILHITIYRCSTKSFYIKSA